MKAKSVVIRGVKDVAVMEHEVDVQAMHAKQCLIETEVSLISAGTELSRVFGLKKGANYPAYPGYCSVGTILKCGSDLSDVKEGDRVLFSAPHCSLQLFEREKSDGGVLYRLDPETTAEEGAFLMMAWIAMNGILPAEVKLGDTVAVMGMGTLGLVCAIYYQQMGARVIALEPVKHRADIARKCGICEVIDCAGEHQMEEVMTATDQRGVDIVVDATGLSSCIETGLAIAAKYGQVLLMGSPRSEWIGNMTNAFSHIHMKMLTVIGCLNRRYPYQEKEGSSLSMVRSMKYIEGLLQNKTIDVNLFISHHVAPNAEELMEAYDGLMNHKERYTGVIIDWKKEESL